MTWRAHRDPFAATAQTTRVAPNYMMPASQLVTAKQDLQPTQETVIHDTRVLRASY